MRNRVVAIIASIVVVAGGLLATEHSAASAATHDTYRVDCSSGHNGDGRRAPWNSLSAVWNHGAFSPGDRILFKRGTTCRGRLEVKGSGTASSPIVMGAYGRGALPTLAGGGTPDLSAVLTLRDVEYWTVQDLRVTNHGASLRSTLAYRSGVAVFNSGVGRLLRGIVIQRLRVERVTSAITLRAGKDSRNWGGISVVTFRGMSKSPEGFDHLTIRDNVVDHVGRTGIVTTNRAWPKGFDRDPRITGNTVTWARSDSILVRGAVGGRVDHNLSAHGADMFPCPECGPVNNPGHASAGIWTAQSRKVRIDHNEVYGMHSKGGDGEAFDADRSAVDTVIEYNYAHDNEAGALFFCGSVGAIARFNILEDNGTSDIAFIGDYPAMNTRIYNNTVYHRAGSRGGIVRYFNGKSGSIVKFYNNLVYSHGTGTYSWPTAVRSRANTYIGTHRSGEPRGGGYSRVDPRLRAPGSGRNGMTTLRGYRPTKQSVMKRGIAVPKSITRDFFGKRISSKRPPRGAAG